MQRFQHTADGVVGGRANDGGGKLTLVPYPESVAPPRTLCREGALPAVGEQELLAHIDRVFGAAGMRFPRSLLVNYYISLKTNPFVVLAGRQGHGKAEFVALFAEALLGAGSQQYALIPAGAPWPSATGEGDYYRGLRARFASLRFLDLLQDAASPAGAGRVFLACFNKLRPEEVAYYFTTLLHVDDEGRKWLKLPGQPSQEWPLVPPNVYITATVDSDGASGLLSRAVLRQAALLQFRTPLRQMAVLRKASSPPPVGYQRLWLRTAGQDVAAARDRLEAILGAGELQRLRASDELQRLLWRGGVVITTRELQELTAFVAGSFDERGRGLFVADAQRNAQIAFDAQVVQRVIWRLHDAADESLLRDLDAFLDRLAPVDPHQAVA